MEQEIFTLDKILGVLTVMLVSPMVVSGIISALVIFWSKSRAEVNLEKEKSKFLEEVQTKLENKKGEIERAVQEHIEKIKKEHQKEIDEYKAEIEKSKAKFFRYSEHQFKLYNDLWLSLYELKLKADKLWVLASASNLKEFINQLIETKKVIGRNILLLEDNHSNKLTHLIESFSNYQIGKENLVSLRGLARNQNLTVDEWQIENLVNANHNLMNEYTNLLEEIRREMKTQIKE